MLVKIVQRNENERTHFFNLFSSNAPKAVDSIVLKVHVLSVLTLRLCEIENNLYIQKLISMQVH